MCGSFKERQAPLSDRSLRQLERTWRASGRVEDRDAYLREIRKQRGDQLYCLLRSRKEEPALKRLIKLNASSLFEWFQRGFNEVTGGNLQPDFESEDPGEACSHWIETQMGIESPVLTNIFYYYLVCEEGQPKTIEALEEVIHLGASGGGESSSNTEVVYVYESNHQFLDYEVSFNFFTKAYSELYPEIFTYLFHEGWRLPKQAKETGSFESLAKLPKVTPREESNGCIYMVFLTDIVHLHIVDFDFDEHVWKLDGVRLPELPNYLRAVIPDNWPSELLAIRAGLGENDRSVKKALERVDRYGFERLASISNGSYEELREAISVLGSNPEPHEDFDKPTPIASSAHIIQTKTGFSYAFQAQWIIFDDLWASAHPALAESIIRFGLKHELFDQSEED